MGLETRLRHAAVPIGAALAAALGACRADSGPEPAAPPTAALRASAPPPPAAPEELAPCADRDPLRSAYFGELHIHTRLSFDAYAWDVRPGPDEAYRFARGEAIELAPLDAAGRGKRRIALERPLDFAAVTDHAEFFGPVSICSRPGSEAYDSAGCRTFRGDVPLDTAFGELGARMSGLSRGTAAAPGPSRSGSAALAGLTGFAPEVCGPDGSWCKREATSTWRQVQAAAERHYDRCRFTTFKAYEYTATPELSKVHRNVIFRSGVVPELPITAIDEPEAPELWRRLEERCLDAGTGCDALAIPHNSNLANGRMFTLPYREAPLAVQVEQATRRARLEPLAEIMQIKGDSECANGLSGVAGGSDELCSFEKFRAWGENPPDCGDGVGAGALAGKGCSGRMDFVRYALAEGVKEQARIGVNPLKLGIIASTDGHNANPGDVEETSYDGWGGKTDASPQSRLAAGIGTLGNLRSNPGGLVGLWSEENSRERLFQAMRRREAFGTSGPRIQVRFFGGWSYARDLCSQPDFAVQGYAGGVPMGGDLPPRPAGAAAPRFAVRALADPGTEKRPGGLLQRIQIIKGHADAAGNLHQEVYDVAGNAQNAASVNESTCEVSGPGERQLCGFWSDPAFDPAQHAVYYARVVENPSCRWNAHQCAALPKRERPASCSDPTVPKQIQERAWTSPIWYTAN
jgi:hypothetical protein